VASSKPTTAQMLGQLSAIGMSFVLALAIGFGGGFWLDLRLGSKPWLSFLGFFLGLTAGVLNVYRVMRIWTASSAHTAGGADPQGPTP